MTKILLSGCFGKMGRVIADCVQGRDDCTIVAGIDVSTGTAAFPVFSSFADCTAVIATTGFSPEQVTAIHAAATAIPIFFSANMSIGIAMLTALAKKAAAVLGTDFDIEIVEKHHNQKLDAPSGTAMMLADALKSVREGQTEFVFERHSVRQKRRTEEIGISSVRGGTIVGEHDVIFAGHDEVITLSHSAQSKEIFAVGAVNAARFLAGQAPGLYDMTALMA